MVMQTAEPVSGGSAAAVEQLIREHRHFRAKFAALNAADYFWPESKWVIRELGFSLLRQLENHSQREMRLATDCYLALGRAGSSELQRLAIDHSTECRTLRHVNQALVRPTHKAPQYTSQLIQQFLDQCNRQIDRQEHQFFPLLECVLGLKPSGAHRETGLQSKLNGAMTGSAVVEHFPQARGVFDRLRVDIGLEGYYSIQEIALRRGLRSRELLEELEQVIAG